jgi:hypothetical protein
MEVPSAIRLIENLVFIPGWTFTATDHTKRFEGTILVRIDYPARASERDEAPEYAREIKTYAVFPVVVSECDDVAIYLKVLWAIIEIQEHEAREFLRVDPTMWAPFHPHRVDGMKRWAALGGCKRFDDLGELVRRDLQFGIG